MCPLCEAIGVEEAEVTEERMLRPRRRAPRRSSPLPDPAEVSNHQQDLQGPFAGQSCQACEEAAQAEPHRAPPTDRSAFIGTIAHHPPISLISVSSPDFGL